ncbi:MAG: hypothetical protein NTU89_02865 [Candidatus Dependentiae bacterium]|nr:hypothetical protein [Candidatus Dependentiae bacterium]
MNQNMNTWIATALGVITVKFIIQWHNFNKIENDFDLLIYIVDVAGTIIFLAACRNNYIFGSVIFLYELLIHTPKYSYSPQTL